MTEEEALVTCYGPGSIAGAIIGTLLITLALAGAGLLLYNIYWRSRKGKHLVLVSDVENPDDHYAFDNPNFREATPIKQSFADETKSAKLDLSWLSSWSPLHAFSTPRNDKQRSLDDTDVNNSQVKVVSLKSHDFTGLGFSVFGNMRDGIFVKDVLHRGPAFESGNINPGDRIESICISFRHMVFEDALTILSYASPYEVQVQVDQNKTSQPSTLLRKRENTSATTREPMMHPLYRSQSIADMGSIDKSIGRRSNDKRATKTSETSSSDYATLKLSPNPTDRKKEHHTMEKRAIDTVDGHEQPKHPKFGVRVLPHAGVNTSRLAKDQSDNEQNIVIEQSLTSGKTKDEDNKDVKTIITKGFQNLKEKINQNTLGRKKKDEEASPVAEQQKIRVSTPPLSGEDRSGVEAIPLEVERAGAMAQSNRKSVSADSLAARRPVSDIVIEITQDISESETPQKKSKGKAPAPPQPAHSEVISVEDNVEVSQKNCSENIFERQREVVDSDSDAEAAEMTCTHVTIHHSPVTEEPESNRKAASLGDLSRLEEEDNYSGTLERAVSLDLDGAHGKKRKAPQPPPEEFPFEEDGYRKEPRLEGYNTFQRRLKKSSDFGRLEDALSGSDTSLPANPVVEAMPEMTTEAANKIQEFSSWLEEVRKPPDGNHHLTLSVNPVVESEDVGIEPLKVDSTESSPSEVGSGTVNLGNAVGDKSSAGAGTDVLSINDAVSTLSSSPTALESPRQNHTSSLHLGDSSSLSRLEESENPSNIHVSDSITLTADSPIQVNSSRVTSSIEMTEVNSELRPSFILSVNGKSMQEPSCTSTVLLISQPNSLELEGITPITPEDETPPQLPTSPPPTSSLTYITEIHVTTPEPESDSPPPKVSKPQRKDITPESSRIPIRTTMKSETGQKVLAAIQSLASKELDKKRDSGNSLERKKNSNDISNVPTVAGFYLKKVPPAVPPRRNDSGQAWTDGVGKDRVNGTPRHVPMPGGVGLPVKTSATRIVFESQGQSEEF